MKFRDVFSGKTTKQFSVMFLLSAACCGLAGLTTSTPAAAASNGVTRAMSCDNCFTANDFVVAALKQANSIARPGMYVVTSKASPRTAFVRVTGEPPANCIPSMGCNPNYLVNARGSAMGLGGSPLGSDAELVDIDLHLFGVDRALPMIVNLNPTDCGRGGSGSCGTSFAATSDIGVSLEIEGALDRLGLSSAQRDQLRSITVEFPNGDQAVYKKVSRGDWVWGGMAWNSAHDHIDRNGRVTSKNTASGNANGVLSGNFPDPISGGAFVYGIGYYDSCLLVTTVAPPGGVEDEVLITSTFPPC